jgi:uroporphyrinogen decarboxylase
MSYLTTPTGTAEYLHATPRKETTWAGRAPSHRFWTSAFWRHFPEADDTAEMLASETLRYQRLHPSAFVKLSPPGTTMAAGYGLLAEWQGDSLGRRTILKRPIQKLADWQRVLNGSFDPEITRYLLESARAVVRATQDELVLQTVFAPLTIATQLAGLPLLREHLDAAPAFMQAVLEALCGQVRDVVQSLTKCGIHGVYLATQSMNKSSFSPAEYAIWGRPCDAACIAAAACLPCNVFHLHGEAFT